MTLCAPVRVARSRVARVRVVRVVRVRVARAVSVLVAAAPAGRRWWWPAAGYPAGLVALAAVQRGLTEADADRLVAWASTDLDNLARNPVGSMLLSAFVTQGSLPVWVGLGLLGLGVLGRRLGAVRTLLVVTAAHVVGTLVSQGVVAWRLQAGLADPAERYALDVGPSYVVVGALAAGLLGGGRWGRPACALGLGLLAPFLLDGLDGFEVAAVGHLVAIVVGLLSPRVATMVDRVRARGSAFAGDLADADR